MTGSDDTAILTRAAQAPDDVQARIDAAYHCDAHRTEEEAIGHYDAAWRLGVPAEQRRDFMLGYGSTLKNVGRHDESESILLQAMEEHPTDRALPVFLALTLHGSGRSDAAVAQLLDVLLLVNDRAIEPYRRALTHYAEELRGRAD